MFAFSRFVILLLVLSSCAQVQTFKLASRPALATAADELLDSAIYGVCIATSVAAVSRRFNTEDQMATWREFCKLNQARALL